MTNKGILPKLHHDHQAIGRLLAAASEIVENGSGEHSQLFGELRAELLSHFRAEDRALYAALEANDSCRDVVKDGREEHDEIAEIVADLARSEDEEQWLSTLAELEEAFAHHAREVEGETFATASQALGEEQLDALGEAYRHEKARARSEVTGLDEDEDEDRPSRDSIDATA